VVVSSAELVQIFLLLLLIILNLPVIS
jgi:hypothetical protein